MVNSTRTKWTFARHKTCEGNNKPSYILDMMAQGNTKGRIP